MKGSAIPRRRFGSKLLPLAIASSVVIAGQPVAAQSRAIDCRACASPRDVVLMIGPASASAAVTALSRLWIERRSRDAQRRHGVVSGQAIPVVSGFVEDIDGFRKLVQKTADNCLRIKVLGIIGHGSSGFLQIGAEGVSLHNLGEAFGRGMDCIMTPGAAIEFFGCKVGRGCDGAKFLRSAGTLLLRKGGKIIAPEDYVFGNALFRVAPRSVFGTYREFEFRPVSLDGWSEVSGGDPECSDRQSLPERRFGALNHIEP